MPTTSFMDRARHSLIRYGAAFHDTEITAARGARVFCADGRSLLDFTSGQMSAVLGHAHPEIVETIREMAGRLTHLYSGMLSAPVVELAEALGATLPDGLDRVLMSGFYAIPLFNVSEQWIARWNRIERPSTTALTGYLPETWWHKAEPPKADQQK